MGVRPGAYPRVEDQNNAPALLANVKLGLKGLPWPSALAYLASSSVEKKKSFIALTVFLRKVFDCDINSKPYDYYGITPRMAQIMSNKDL